MNVVRWIRFNPLINKACQNLSVFVIFSYLNIYCKWYCQQLGVIINTYNTDSMLFQLVWLIFFIIPALDCHMMKPTLSHKTSNHHDKYAHSSVIKDKTEDIPHQNHLHHLTLEEKEKILELARKRAAQRQKSELNASNFVEKASKEVQKNNIINDNMEQLQLQILKPDTQTASSFEKQIKKQKKNQINALNNQKSAYLNVKDSIRQDGPRFQEQSEFVNQEEKTLFMKVVQALSKFTNKFSSKQSESVNQLSQNISILNNSSQLEQSANTALHRQNTNIKDSQIVSSSANFQSTLQSYDVEKASRLINDTQKMTKKRKKFYFIICTLSFGITCIILIKLMERTDRDKKSGIIKVPSDQLCIEQTCIQQI